MTTTDGTHPRATGTGATRRSSRWTLRRLLAAFAVVMVAAGAASTLVASLTATPASADTTTTIINEGGPDGFVAVIKVSGLLDPVMVDFISNSIVDAENEGAVAMIMQADSNGVVVDDARYGELLTQMLHATVPIGIWVGPSGSRLTGKSAQMIGAADQIGVAPGSHLGDAGTPVVGGLDTHRLAPITDVIINQQEATDLGVSTLVAPTIGDMLVNFPGVASKEVTADNGETRREPLTQVRFGQLSLISNLMHTVASPAVAYLLITVGLSLIIFELFTAGVGVAGVVGAGSLILAGYGLWVLPTNWWALVLLGLSMFAFAIDVQTGVPRLWTGIGFVLFVVVSFTLYDGMSISWITLVVAIIGVLLTFLGGMPSMVRTRFSTPTIGREWMVGEMGRAVTAVDPDGVVRIREALWRASTNRATPIEELDRVRVIGIDGLVLEVEPETGGARDHRDRSGRRGRGAAADGATDDGGTDAPADESDPGSTAAD